MNLFWITNFLFADEGAQQGGAQTMIMIAVALIFFYLIMWRPEQKRRRELEERRSQLQKGDKVTAMGIVGTVEALKERTVVVIMVDGAKVEFVKEAVSEVNPDWLIS